MLLEMYYKEDMIFGEDLVAYRLGNYKLIRGVVRDDDYYSEALPGQDYIHKRMRSGLARTIEYFIRGLEIVCGIGQMDALRLTITHMFLHSVTEVGESDTVRLFDILNDPLEERDLSHEDFAIPIVAAMNEKLLKIKAGRPTQQKVWMQFHMQAWKHTHVRGDCSMNTEIKQSDCFFTHPWIADVRAMAMIQC